MNDSDPWIFLKAHTAARIAQGRAGRSLPTSALLSFQLDHALARDAVHSILDTAALLTQLSSIRPDPLVLQSQAADRQTYLQRPDLGRKLSQVSRTSVQDLENRPGFHTGFDLCIVIADGLSATAVNRHALPVVSGLVGAAQDLHWSLAPICLVEQGRVAVGDDIAHSLRAELLVVLIGERPGLSSPDSLGAYLTYRPRPGLTDESRNCVSNIRPGRSAGAVDSSEGLACELAVPKIIYLLTEMKRRQLSGVLLKDDMPMRTLARTSSPAVTGQSPETPS